MEYKRCVYVDERVFTFETKLKFSNINSFHATKNVLSQMYVNVKPESFFSCLFNFFRCGKTNDGVSDKVEE